GDSATSEMEIAGLGGTPDIQVALVADPSDTIRLSTDPDLVGRPLDGILGPDYARGSPFRQSVLGEFLYTDTSITAAYPYRVPPGPGELRSTRTGVVVLSYDLRTPTTVARQRAFRESLIQGAVVLALCLLTWAGLHTLVTVPLRRLADGTRRLAAGESGPALSAGGPSEIQDLTVSFNLMAEQVASRQRALARANRALRALSDCKQEVSAARDEPSLLQNFCRVVVQQAGYRLAWVGFIEPTGSKVVTPVASAGHDAGYLQAARVTWDDSPLGQGPTGQAIRTGQPVVCEDILTDPRLGAWRSAQLERGYGASAVLPLCNADGAVFGALSVYAAERGVFDEKEVALLSEIAQELAFGIQRLRARKHQEEVERSLAANEAMLRQVQKMEAIGQLAGGVAHDFNNILGAIMMQAALASEENVSPELREALEEIRVAAERGANLTRQLLLFSRKQVMQSRTLDLSQAVTHLARMLQRVLREDVRMELRPHPGPLFVRADPGMIDQILMNLAVNARDAMPGGGRLVIETGLVDLPEPNTAVPPTPAGRYACIRVTDTGSGIAPEVLPHIFEPFFTTKAAGQGTGLGLATVFGIVQQHRGGMRVESGLGRGTTFEVLLPLAAEPADADAAEPGRRPRRHAAERILVVEDDGSVRNLIQQALEREGYSVLVAANGVQALQLWEQRSGP
ncbi:MAG TPA: GAF domain-containing protein, partial [Gemmatimonadales bacterium]|nr:GAF domain-containing protein [Gemmatimonadales bacterium]